MRYRRFFMITTILFVAMTGHAYADTFILRSGDAFEGITLRSMGNSLTIKHDGGGMTQLLMSDIERVEVTLSDGGHLGGRLVSWDHGVYLVDTGHSLSEIKDGVATTLDRQVPDAATINKVASKGMEPTM